MSRYHFHLRRGQDFILDTAGTEFADEVAAREHARKVASDLLRNAHPKIRYARLEVADEAGNLSFALPIVAVDEVLGQLPPHLHSTINQVCDRVASLHESIGDLQLTLHQVRQTIARVDRTPFLAAVDGRRI